MTSTPLTPLRVPRFVSQAHKNSPLHGTQPPEQESQNAFKTNTQAQEAEPNGA